MSQRCRYVVEEKREISFFEGAYEPGLFHAEGYVSSASDFGTVYYCKAESDLDEKL
jgi:hypothetical protein